MTQMRHLETSRGVVPLPTYIPVTTFGGKYPLDDLIRPYLPRLARAVMISYHYARQASDEELPSLPRFVDSGGFASLFERARVVRDREIGVIEIITDDGIDRIHPSEVLDLQERIADVGFPLDFPIPPSLDLAAAEERQRLTLANARWALANRRRRDLVLYGCVQGWDLDSFRRCAAELVAIGYGALAIGGLVPRALDRALITGIVRAVREEAGDRPVHVLGLGTPELVRLVQEAGADSVDSSSFVKLAADGRTWTDPTLRLPDASPSERLMLALQNLAHATRTTLPLGAHLAIGGAVRPAAHVPVEGSRGETSPV